MLAPKFTSPEKIKKNKRFPKKSLVPTIKSGTPEGIRTPDLLVRSRCSFSHSVQRVQESNDCEPKARGFYTFLCSGFLHCPPTQAVYVSGFVSSCTQEYMALC